MESVRDIDNLTLPEFMNLVKQMRFNQRRYKQSSRKRDQIKKTLEPLENEVDELVALFHQRQQKLF